MLKTTLATIAIILITAASGCLEWTEDSRGNLQSVGLPMVPIWTAAKPVVTPQAQGLDANAASDSDWLADLNKWRQMAGVRPVGENSNLSHGCQLHAEYLVDQLPSDANRINSVAMSMGSDAHRESTGKEGFTDEGAQAAVGGRHVEGVLQAADVSWGQPDPKDDIDGLIIVPFHRLSLLAPWAKVAGFGRAGTAPRSAAALSIRGPEADATATQVAFPPSGSTIPVTSMGRPEWPNPLSSCPGYNYPVGLPVTVQLGRNQSAVLASHSFFDETDNRSLPSCAFDSLSYNNPDPGQQQVASQALRSFGGIVLIPQQTLIPGHTYKVSMRINGHDDSWSFKVSENARPDGPTLARSGM